MSDQEENVLPPSIELVTVTPRQKYMCHYSLNEGEERWMEYDELLRFLQGLCPSLSAQFMELFITHDPFVLDVPGLKITLLGIDEDAELEKRRQLVRNATNANKSLADQRRQELEKVSPEKRSLMETDSAISKIYGFFKGVDQAERERKRKQVLK